MSEQIMGVVKAYSVGKPDSIVVVIPKEIHKRLGKHPKGQHFLVKLDARGRIIYEPINQATEEH
jgi:hypothetical protein